MITTLGADQRKGIFRRTGKRWPFYAWDGQEWRVYPVDPRRSVSNLISVPASNQVDGEIHSSEGFEEVAHDATNFRGDPGDA